MKVFKKKIYLLIVFFNSVQIIWEVVKICLIFINSSIKKSGGDITFIDKIPEIFFITAGLLDVTSLFLLIGVLPALLALKYKGRKFEITMAGSLVSIIMAGAFLFGTIFQMATLPIYSTSGTILQGRRRIVFCTLLVCSNVPYLEWALREWRDIWRMRN